MTLTEAIARLEGNGIDIYPVDGEELYQVWDDVFLRTSRMTKQELIELASKFPELE